MEGRESQEEFFQALVNIAAACKAWFKEPAFNAQGELLVTRLRQSPNHPVRNIA